MMCDRVNFTGDPAFRDSILVPFAREILLFFDKHYPRGVDGKLRLEPAQVVETWWIAVNPSPDIAGLRFCMDQLLAMKAGTTQDKANWLKFRNEIPEVSLQTIEGRQAIAPAEKWEKKRNAENGELYPVFPFRCFNLGLGTSDIVSWTMKNRSLKDAFACACWTQDQIDWAYAGNATEAANGLVRRFRVASPMVRFPMFGREGPDSCPDFDHFGSGATALQRMLLQEEQVRILLLPAWPKDWDVNFKLHAMQNTTVEGEVKDGKIIRIKVSPESRRKDLVLGEGWNLVK
jgi:alpha-L-fucosidase 2